MATNGTPSFFRVLINPSSPYLPLPTAFVSRHLKSNVPLNPTLKSRIGEFSWKVKMKQIGGSYCFTHGWDQVAKDAQLEYGDFLVFCLVDPSTFQVSIFGSHGCEKDLFSEYSNVRSKTRCTLNVTTAIKVEDDDDDDDDDVKIVKQEDDDDDDDALNVKEEEYDDDDVKIVEEKEEEDDDDVKIVKEEEEDDDDDVEKDGDDDLSFQKVISDKSHEYIMRLPKKFVEDAGLEGKRSVTVTDLEGREWCMRLHMAETLKQKAYTLTSGWQIFREHNELSEGDVCLFKFITAESKLTLAQVIKRTGVACKKLSRKKEVVKRKRAQSSLNEEETTRGWWRPEKSCVIYF